MRGEAVYGKTLERKVPRPARYPAQLMSHLDYALAHTDWHAELRRATVTPSAAGRHMTSPWYSTERTEQTACLPAGLPEPEKRALGVLPADLNLRDQVGPTLTRCLHLPMTTNWLFHSFLPLRPAKLFCKTAR